MHTKDVCAANAAPPVFLSRRCRRHCARVAFVGSYFPLGMKLINSQFIHVSANAAFRDSHYTHLNLF